MNYEEVLYQLLNGASRHLKRSSKPILCRCVPSVKSTIELPSCRVLPGSAVWRNYMFNTNTVFAYKPSKIPTDLVSSKPSSLYLVDILLSWMQIDKHKLRMVILHRVYIPTTQLWEHSGRVEYHNYCI